VRTTRQATSPGLRSFELMENAGASCRDEYSCPPYQAGTVNRAACAFSV
jgi:hypothetical protein